MTDTFDIRAYLSRIGYSGPTRATLETLAALQRHHTEAIAFENLDPLLRRPIALDPASLQHKLVASGRGGYCYEQNGLLLLALKSLGFAASGLAGRVLWNRPDGALTPRSHMVLSVDIGGETWLVDAGFGGMTATGSLSLTPGLVQETPHEQFRLLEDRGDYTLQVLLGETWRNIYRLDLREQLLPDYEVSNYYAATHPTSHFVTGLLVSRTAPGTRFSLNNNVFSVHRTGGGTERQTLDTPAALRRTLTDTFLLTLPDTPDLETTLTRLTRPAA